MLTSDDTALSKCSVEHMTNVLPKFLNYTDTKEDPLVAHWSGIMGFTPDLSPYVSKLPVSVTGRTGDEEYIAAGVSGYGMPYCWLVGEALAKMLMGQDVGDELPAACLITEERLDSSNIAAIAKEFASMR